MRCSMLCPALLLVVVVVVERDPRATYLQPNPLRVENSKAPHPRSQIVPSGKTAIAHRTPKTTSFAAQFTGAQW